VTTPDLLDFIPEAIYFPFFNSIDEKQIDYIPSPKRDELVIVHATNHEGIDGTKYIREACKKLQSEGIAINLVVVKKTPFEKAIEIYKNADISVGKLFMGFYANFQIECMSFGKPTLCYIREDLSHYIPDSPIINTTFYNVYDNLKKICLNKKLREKVGKESVKFVKKYHNNNLLSKQLIEIYKSLIS